MFSGKGRKFEELGDTYDLWLLSATGAGLVQLTKNESVTEYHPIWSVDGKWIAFTDRETGSVYRIPSSGGTPLPVGEIQTNYQVAWSPDGTKLAVCAKGIHIVTLQGDTLNTLVPDMRPSGCAWSPDGNTLAFSDYNTGIWVVNTDGSSSKLVIKNESQEQNFEEPDWSPDGRLLAVEKHVSSEVQEIWIFPVK